MNQVNSPPRSIRRYLRFSLRAFLLVVALVGAAFGWLAMRIQHVRRERAAIAAIGNCQVLYDYELRTLDHLSDEDAKLFNQADNPFLFNIFEANVYDSRETPPGPSWLRKWLGDDILANVAFIDASGPWRPMNGKALVADQAADAESRGLRGVHAERTLAPLAQFSNLQFVVLGDDIVSSDLQALMSLENLKVLVLHGLSRDADVGRAGNRSVATPARQKLGQGEVDHKRFDRIEGSRSLKHLILRGDEVNDEDVLLLRQLTGLETLSLRNTLVTDDGITVCAGMAELERLDVHQAPLRGHGFDKLHRLKKLRILGLSNSQVDDVGLESIGKFMSLVELDLSNTKITDTGLENLAGLKNLRRLDLGANRISDEGLAILSQLTELRWLDLDSTDIGDTTLAYVAKLCKLEHLGLNSTQVTDAGLAHLRGLSKLEELQVANTRMTEVGLECIRKLPKLRRLDLYGADVSYASVIALKIVAPALDLRVGSRRAPAVAPVLSEVDWTQPDDDDDE
jgi:hypothetical protein